MNLFPNGQNKHHNAHPQGDIYDNMQIILCKTNCEMNGLLYDRHIGNFLYKGD